MGVTIDVITPGDGCNYPATGDELTMHYTTACVLTLLRNIAANIGSQ